jgi:tetratricopeptide (TPR) repeat protein
MSNDHQSDDPWRLIAQRQYEEAVVAYDAQLVAGKEKSPGIVANRAIALLCLGRLSEALEGFATANDIARRSLGGHSAPYLENIGTVLWLMGHRSIAKELYRSAVDGIRYGTIHYADIAGGVGQGLLLWYAGITTEDRNATEHAVDYLTHLAKKSRIKNWPGPLALYVIERHAQSLLPGAQSFEELLRESFNTDNLHEIAEQAKSDILTRRHLIQALFVLGTKHREKGDEDGCRRALQQCAQLENPHVQEEWYLAAAEMGLIPPVPVTLLDQRSRTSHSQSRRGTRRQQPSPIFKPFA